MRRSAHGPLFLHLSPSCPGASCEDCELHLDDPHLPTGHREPPTECRVAGGQPHPRAGRRIMQLDGGRASEKESPRQRCLVRVEVQLLENCVEKAKLTGNELSAESKAVRRRYRSGRAQPERNDIYAIIRGSRGWIGELHHEPVQSSAKGSTVQRRGSGQRDPDPIKIGAMARKGKIQSYLSSIRGNCIRWVYGDPVAGTREGQEQGGPKIRKNDITYNFFGRAVGRSTYQPTVGNLPFWERVSPEGTPSLRAPHSVQPPAATNFWHLSS
ncbi:hypothetical protein FB451DRAFT_1358976 [Mycena latifolia]|nr:hypothetical protein FB451DRAFT_1358976 [Mycena latifolia]